MLTLTRRRPSLAVLVICFVALAGAFLVKNRYFFDVSIYEDGDFAANSIIIEDAKHFDLLVGNYSRQGFSHPGPEAFYLQAAGEAVLHDGLHVVPTPYNGQAIAVLLQNAMLIALALTLIYRAARSWLAVVGGAAATLAFGSAYQNVLTSTWMPYYYFPPFLLLMVATAALAAGDAIALPFVVLAGGILVHGHVEFGLFVPVLAVSGAVGFVRHHQGIRRALSARREASWSALVILLLFLLPMGLNLLLHWPGEFGDYLKYATSDKSGRHSIRQGLDYVLGFWSRGDSTGLVAAATMVMAAAALSAALPRSTLRRLLLACLTQGGIVTLLMWFYAVRGIDDLSEKYLGFFYWAVPLLMILVAVTAASALLSTNRRAMVTGGIVSLVALVLSGRGMGLVNSTPGAPGLPAAVDSLTRARTRGDQALVVTLAHDAWPDVVGVLVEANRRGVRACVNEPAWEFMMTRDFICTQDEAASGLHLYFGPPGSTRQPVVATMERSIVTAEPS